MQFAVFLRLISSILSLHYKVKVNFICQ